MVLVRVFKDSLEFKSLCSDEVASQLHARHQLDRLANFIDEFKTDAFV